MRLCCWPFVLFVVALSCSSALADSEALKHDFEEANRLYQGGEFQKAIDSYLKVVAAGVENPVLYYNLGNSYFKTGRLGYAIAMYHRALKLDPRNDDIKANLAFAQQFRVDNITQDEINPIWNWYKGIILHYTSNEWTVAASVVLVLFLALFAFRIWTGSRSSLVKGLLIASFAIFVVVATCCGTSIHFNCGATRGAIVVPEVSIKAGPGSDFDEQFIAHEGLTFLIMKQESGWYQGIFDNRLKGWIRVSDAVKI